MVLVSEARSPSAPPGAFPPAVVELLAELRAAWVNVGGGKPREAEAESLRVRIVEQGEVRSFSSSGERGEASSAALPLSVAFEAMSRALPIRMEGFSLIGGRGAARRRGKGKEVEQLTRSLLELQKFWEGRAFFFFFFSHSSFFIPLFWKVGRFFP